jgi:hypothetical protein
MTIVNVLAAVFSRYDCLRNLALSLEQSTRRPDVFWVIDHGYDAVKIQEALRDTFSGDIAVVSLPDPGACYAGNWSFRHVVGEKIWCGDDVTFEANAIERMVNTPGDFILPRRTLNAFACHLLRDETFARVGLFDESISPRYLYYEDCDYSYRMGLLGIKETVVEDAVVNHVGSATYKSYTDEQMEDHHRKFIIAKKNYIAKWGGTPHEETFTLPYNGERA